GLALPAASSPPPSTSLSASRTAHVSRLLPLGWTRARANDSAAGCRLLQSPHPPEALRMTRTLSLCPAFSPRLSLSSNPAKQSPQFRSTLLSASPELLSLSQSTPPPARPTSPSPDSPLFPPPPCHFYHAGLPYPTLPTCWLGCYHRTCGLRRARAYATVLLKEDSSYAQRNHHPVVRDARSGGAARGQPAVGASGEERRHARSRRQGRRHGAGFYADGHPPQ